MSYPFKTIEKKWQEYWDSNVLPEKEKKFYVLEMLPYPSGKLHMGHVRNYTIGDIIARYYVQEGYEVLHPMGWDSFGMPAENAAKIEKASPKDWTYKNIAAMREDLKSLGFSYDWRREFATSDPEYYHAEQKLFLDFFKEGLIQRKEFLVNWDPVEQSVLANEQVVDGRGWRSGALVEQKKLQQWSFAISKYSEELLNDLQKLTGWPEKVRKMQENWIGKSSGAVVKFELSNGKTLEIYTTRPDTLFGASFCAISPYHPLAEQDDPALKEFIAECQHTAADEHTFSVQEKKGYKLALTAKHPWIPDLWLPVYVANFVLMEYGTGAIFACPAEDERDREFAEKYNLPIIEVIVDGKMINSDFLNGLSPDDAKEKAILKLEETSSGSRRVNYRLRDWCISRQRYWGCPIPIIHCNTCGMVPAELPVILPDDVDFEKSGNPLDHHPTFKHVKCPKCQADALRETDTLDTFFESSWYFLRYCAPKHQTIDKKECQKWLPVGWYIGGIEHAVMHLLYARFFTKVLRDLGYIDLNEPFQNLLTQGMVCHATFQDSSGNWVFPNDVVKKGDEYFTKDGHLVAKGRSEKMSKSKKNIVSPEEIIDAYGVDVARLFITSDTPCDKDFDWSEESLDGAWRYLSKLWRSFEHPITGGSNANTPLAEITAKILDRVRDSYEKNSFNTIVAFARELNNSLLEHSDAPAKIRQETLKALLLILHPIIPHLTSEIWQKQGFQVDIRQTPIPKPDQNLLDNLLITIAVQINGKLKGTLEVAPNTEENDLIALALQLRSVQNSIEGHEVKKVVVVPKRIVNVVI